MKQEPPLRTKFLGQMILCLMLVTVLFANTTVYGQLSAGDIVVLDGDLDFDPSTDGKGVLFRVDPTTGQRIVLSDFGDASQGALLIPNSTQGMALDDSGNVLVFSSQPSGVFLILRVNPNTGLRTVISDFGNAAQGLGLAPLNGSTAMVVESSGTIVVAGGVGNFYGTYQALYRVDPVTGQRTVLTDFSDPSQGPGGLFMENMRVEATGAILLTCRYSQFSGRGVLLRVDANTGQRMVVSDFGSASQGPLGGCPTDVAVETPDMALVGDPCAEPERGLFRVDLGTGSRTLLSNFRDSAQGPLGSEPRGVTTEASGAILVADASAGLSSVEECIIGKGDPFCFMRPVGAIFRIDPITGARTLVSDFGDSSKGPLGKWPIRVAVAKASISEQLNNTVNNLVSNGSLSQGNGNALISKLQAVINSMNSGNTTAACNQLQAFINQTQALINSRKLTPSQGQALINSANALKGANGC